MENEIVKLNVPNAPALQVAGEYVILKTFCENVGLEYSAQYRRVKRMEEEGTATIANMAIVATDGKNREVVGIHKDDFRLWLLGVNTNSLKDDKAKEYIVNYKREVKQILKDYYENGVAVNTNIITDYEKQMKIIAMAKGFIADDRLASKMEVVISRAMGDTPQIAPQDVPLYVENYLAEKNRLDINSGGFGRKLANLYRMEFGEEPSVEHADVRGRLRTVKAYKESHRYIFDQVLETYK